MTTLERIKKRLIEVERFDLEYIRTCRAYSRRDNLEGEYTRIYDVLSILRDELEQGHAEPLGELKAEIMSLFGECTCSDDYTRRKKKDPSCHYHDYKDSIDYVFDQYQGQGREWVSVEDRLPDAGEPVWIVLGDQKPMESVWLVISSPDLYLNCYDAGRGFWSWGHRNDMVLLEGVTHWCPRIVDVPPAFTEIEES